jgi:uncharacterized membrane-anchored protein
MRRINMRLVLVIAGLVLVLGVANYDIWQKQQLIENGRQILLELRPVDPRSLIQGDFMQLRYAERIFPRRLSGVTTHIEKCAIFRGEGNELVIINSCDEPVAVVFMPRGQNAREFALGPMERLATGTRSTASYVYTTCPAGYVSSVPVREGRRSLISRSQYVCIDPAAPRKRTGIIVLALDADGVGTSGRHDDGSPLGKNEMRLQYKYILGRADLALGAESFFFQEGQAEIFQDARYGVLRVDEDGASVLVGLANSERQLITPPQ